MARLVSVVLAVLTVAVCLLAGREATGRWATGLLAGSVVGFWPQFSFRGMNIANDVLAALGGALATWLLLRLLRRGFTWPVACGAALAVALALLAKINTIFLLGPLVVTLLLAPGAGGRVRWWWRLAPLGLTLALWVPWLGRNLLLYGDFFAQAVMAQAIPSQLDRKPLLSPYFLHPFPVQLVRSFVGNFGWLNIPLPIWLVLVYLLFLVIALVGVMMALRQRQVAWTMACLLLSIGLLNLATVVYINLTLTQPQGRFLFPALAAFGTVVAVGLEGLPRWSGRASLAVAGSLALLNVAILVLVVRPVYW